MTARRLMQILSENDPEMFVIIQPEEGKGFMALKSVSLVSIDAFRGKVLVFNGFMPKKPERKRGKIF